MLRLYFAAALSIRAISRSLGTSPSTVGEYPRRAKVAGLAWPVPKTIDDAGLERRLFPAPPSSRASRPLPVCSEVHRELRRKSVALALLWEEYKTLQPDGLQYSWFCDHYRAWAAKLDLVMRQEQRAGEKLFVDYAGQTVPVVDRETGEKRDAQVFVAVLGASSYTFGEATWTQTLPDWTASHVRTFEFFGGGSGAGDSVRRTSSGRPHNGSQRSEPGQQRLVVAPNGSSAGESAAVATGSQSCTGGYGPCPGPGHDQPVRRDHNPHSAYRLVVSR